MLIHIYIYIYIYIYGMSPSPFNISQLAILAGQIKTKLSNNHQPGPPMISYLI